MRNGTYTARRREQNTSYRADGAGRNMGSRFATSYSGAYSTEFSRNRNTVRHSMRSLGPLATAGTFLLALMSLGVMYVSQGARATSYDYELSAISAEIEDMEAKRDDLAVESARLTSIAQSEKSTVAAAMEESRAAGYAE